MSDGSAGAWAVLETELDAWAEAGRTARFWWRDDDAGAPTPALERLLDLAAAASAPLSLAVIPRRAEAPLARLLEARDGKVGVLQHGFAHENHAPTGEKKCELVDPVRFPAGLDRLAEGRDRLRSLFGERFQSVLVPPWNRIAGALVPQLPALGFTGLSAYKARAEAAPAAGLVQVNCHLDILQWKPEQRFLGTEAALALLTGHLAAKRRGTADAGEPSGVLSHHQIHDDAAWAFLADLLGRLDRHPAARLLPAAEVFATLPAGAGSRKVAP